MRRAALVLALLTTLSCGLLDSNDAPTPVGTLPLFSMIVGEQENLDVASYFIDPDGDPLTYTATISPAVATTTVSGTSLRVVAETAGTAMLTVTARDPDGLTAKQVTTVTLKSFVGSWRGGYTFLGRYFRWEILLDQNRTVISGTADLTIEGDGSFTGTVRGSYVASQVAMVFTISDIDLAYRGQPNAEVTRISGTLESSTLVLTRQ